MYEQRDDGRYVPVSAVADDGLHREVRLSQSDFVDEQGFDYDCLALYAEEQLERRVGRFFDLLTTHLVRGYEKAWQHAAHAVA